MSEILNIRDLTVSFLTEESEVVAIQDINASISSGETLAFVGESGSGKSVTALNVMRLLESPPAHVKKGSILFKTKAGRECDLLTLSEDELHHIRGNEIGFIFQEPMTSLNPLMRVGNQVAEAILLHKKCSPKEAIEQTKQLFREVKLSNPDQLIHRYPYELSGGQKQRVMIAMAISCDPTLLIADEPTTALDVTVQKSIMLLLKEIQQSKGMAILFITHDLKLVQDFANATIVMYKSNMVESNATKDIFEHPKEAYTQGLISCRPNTQERIRILPIVENFTNPNRPFKKEIISETQFEAKQKELQAAPVLLSVSDLKVSYVTKRNFWGTPSDYYKAVEGVSFEIRQGETVGLVGESGCGKTTTGKAIVKLAQISSGDIQFQGKSIRVLSSAELANYRKDVQIIFQDPYSSLNPSIEIGAAIKEVLDVNGIYKPSERKLKVIELMKQVGLSSDYYHRYPHEFSGGQRQRISIARALACQPKLLICDESVSALDVSVQAQVLNLLSELRELYKLSILFISHDLSVVKHFCDRICVMEKGRIVEMNDSNALYQNPTHDYTKKLLASM